MSAHSPTKGPLPNQVPIQAKANLVLHYILIGMIILLFRLWYLTVLQGAEQQELLSRLSQRTVSEPVPRAEIVDRYNHPLAVNKIRYQVAIVYRQILEVPAIKWQEEGGKKVKVAARRLYIQNLASLLAQKLNLSAKRIEDLIYSHAVFYDHLPFILQDSISEEHYYQLKMLEKEWPGLVVQKAPSRFYPQGKVAADIIGYMGAINRSEYAAISQEMRALKTAIEAQENGETESDDSDPLSLEHAKQRLLELTQRSYSVNDRVGRAGIESYFEQNLRGFYGKQPFLTDARGNLLKTLPGAKRPLPGEHFKLTLSYELQQYAEQLLAENEKIREGRSTLISHDIAEAQKLKQPWVKGGSIIVIEPLSGEILALASHPRYNPNDFSQSALSKHNEKNAQRQVMRWLETESYIASLWDQKEPLIRELYSPRDGFYEETRFLSWQWFLELALPLDSPLNQRLSHLNLNEVVQLQWAIKELLQLSEQTNLRALFKQLEEPLSPPLLPHYKIVAPFLTGLDLPEKELFIDLCLLAADSDLFSEPLLAIKGEETVSHYRDQTAAFLSLDNYLKEELRPLFSSTLFANWRLENEKAFLKEKRALEKQKKQWAKPYLEYLDQQEKELFADFWQQYRWNFLLCFLQKEPLPPSEIDLSPFSQKLPDLLTALSLENGPLYQKALNLQQALQKIEPSIALAYLQTMRSFNDLTRPLYGKYRIPTYKRGVFSEKDLAKVFYRLYSPGYQRNLAYRQPIALGSIFKLITAYQALIERYEQLGSDVKSWQLLNPLTIYDQVYRVGKRWFVGYNEQGEPIPQIYKGGRIPRSAARQIGRVDILRAIETSSNPYFALLAGEVIQSPDHLLQAAKSFGFGSKTGIELPGESSGKLPNDLNTNRTGLYSFAIGQHAFTATPLQAATMLAAIANGGHLQVPQIVRETTHTLASRYQKKDPLAHSIFLPPIIRSILCNGMSSVMDSILADRSKVLLRYFNQKPEYFTSLQAMHPYMIGKSSTSEVMENLELDLKGAKRYRHTWFGGITFKDEAHTIPELVIVVHLRFSGYGREAAPLAASIALKWRELQAQQSLDSN